MNWRVLLLDMNHEPIDVISWQKALQLFVTGRAEVIEEYEDEKAVVRTVSTSFTIPSVLKMLKRFKRKRGARFSRHNVFLRDEFTCQYCRKVCASKDLTIDHVHPQCKGGQSTWENVVLACVPCNRKKDNLTLDECGMKLLKRPVKPDWNQHLVIKLKSTDPAVWRDYLYWHAELQTT